MNQSRETVDFASVPPGVSRKQEELQTRLSTVHNELRKRFREAEAAGTDWFPDWRAQNKNLLEDYSQAMYELATNVWAPRNTGPVPVVPPTSTSQVKCRIEWVMTKLREHFEAVLGIPGTKLKLLDVGSCYNPFSAHDEILEIVALDLCPAPPFRESVYEADFLSIEISEESMKPTVIRNQLPDGTRQLTSLSWNCFDVVVFSFFLEYLPDTKQRLESCRRAWTVLRPGGILFILRPDSNPVTPSCMKLIKELKVGLAFLGFKRLYFEKLKHLWAMGFIKLTKEDRSTYLNSPRCTADFRKVNFSEDALHKLFSIPQDFNDICTPPSRIIPHSTSVNMDPLLFEELPGFDF